MGREEHFREFETLFWQLSRKTEHLWKHLYAKTFPGSQSRIMYLLEQKGPMKMSEFASILHITAGAITTASNILIENEYITRLRDETDRRIVHLALTEKGSRTLNALKEEGFEMTQFVFKDVSDTDLATLCTLFRQASINIDDL